MQKSSMIPWMMALSHQSKNMMALAALGKSSNTTTRRCRCRDFMASWEKFPSSSSLYPEEFFVVSR